MSAAVRLTRSTPGSPPRHAGLEIDAEGAVVGWQTAGQRVGRFGRPLTEVESTALAAALAAAVSADGVEEATGGVLEQVHAEGLLLVLDAGTEAPEGVAALVDLLRGLLSDLADSPVAALEVDVSGSPAAVTLRHVGDQPLTVRLGEVTVRTTAFDADSAILDQGSVEVEVGIDGQLAPGWSLVVEGLTPGALVAGGFVTVNVGPGEADVADDGVLRPIELGWMDE